MARTASIGIRVEPGVHDAAKKAAAADHRTVASLVELLLIRHLREQGFLAAEGTEPAKEAHPAAGRGRRAKG